MVISMPTAYLLDSEEPCQTVRSEINAAPPARHAVSGPTPMRPNVAR